MNPIDRLADHLRAVHRDGAWTDVPVRGTFRGLSADQAASRPIAGAHTAWELLLHLDAWHRAVARRLGGEEVALSPPEDWPAPPAEPTPDDWQEALDTLDAGLDELERAVRGLPPERLFETLPGTDATAYQTILGIGEHDLYHAGQAVLLAKAAG